MRSLTSSSRVVVCSLVALLAPAAALAAAPAPSAPPAASVPAKSAGAPSATAAAPTPTAPAPTTAAPEKKPAAAPEVLATLKVPLLSGRFDDVPVAEVGDEVITLRELGDVLATSHKDRKQTAHVAAVGKGKEFEAILDRTLDIRLIVLEARDMGLLETPDVAQSVATFKDNMLRDVLKRQVVAGAKADPGKVEAYYKAAVRQYKVVSLLFEKKEDAEAVPKLLEGGKKLEDVAKQLLADKKAKGDGVPEVVAAAQLLGPVRRAIEPLKPGQLTTPIATPNGHVVVQLLDVVYPDVPEKRVEAEDAALRAAEQERWVKFFYSLCDKYLKRDDKLLKSIDFEAKKPGFEALLDDKRVVARIKGEKPITVGEVALEEAKGFFHGVDEAIKEKKVNTQKWKTLDMLIYRRLLNQEAGRRKIAQTEEYRHEVEQYTRSVLFGTFVQKIILPDVRVEDAEAQKYYEAHKADYTFPGFYKLESISFRDAQRAQTALARLKAGTDFKWLRNNASDQITGDERAVVLDGTTYAVSGLPKPVVEVLGNATPGDLRLVSYGKQFHVVDVLDVTPPDVKPYDEVKAEILKTLFDEHMTAAVKDWGAKLRQAHPTRIFVTNIEG